MRIIYFLKLLLCIVVDAECTGGLSRALVNWLCGPTMEFDSKNNFMNDLELYLAVWFIVFISKFLFILFYFI